MQSKLPTYFISHGGGPWSYMNDASRAGYAKLEAALARMPEEVGRTPAAVLMISAHWEAPEFRVQDAARPTMLYDYGGFPDYTYQVRYDAPGDPALAARVREMIEAAGMPAGLDTERGFDHGMFTPMHVIYPRADVPTVQLSLKRGLDPQIHLALGRAIAKLRDENVLIIGSGLSYHNLRQFFSPAGMEPSRQFDAWLEKAVLESAPAERAKLLAGWESAPSARAAHPREEHLLPLMVAVGAAEDDKVERVYHERDFMGRLTVSSFRFG
jgi:aromatic ring-opening dioxygenase catalytic subunit (LigB family)